MAVQGPNRDYAFHTLGWYQFEKLCQTILCDLLGQMVQIYSPGNDAGRDAAFSGKWSTSDAEDLHGSFTFQVKYSRLTNAPLTLSVMRQELAKAKDLAKEGLLDNYIVITNYVVTGAREMQLARELRDLTGARTVKIYGVDWLSQLITNSSHLRMLVPRVYGLGDLGEILNARAYQQAKAILSWMPSLKTIVTTDAMQRAARVLRQSRFVLLIGDAMVGKTTAASSLAIAALDDLKLRVVKVRTAEEFATQWNATRNAKQFFWIDDAFGETSFDESLTKGWGRHLDGLGAALEAGASIVMTSRSYIWERAREAIKSYSFDYFRTSKVVIRLQDLSDLERRQMLYNHLRMGDQSLDFKRRIEPLLPEVAVVEPFYPEAARRLASSHYTRGLALESISLKRFFSDPREILIDIVSRLSAAEKALLALIFANNGRLQAPISFDRGAERYINLFGAQPHEVSDVASSLVEVFIKHVVDLDGTITYRFIHPSFSDAIATMTARRTEWLDVYLAGASTMSILRETHAGRPGEKGVEIAVPPSRFGALIDRIRVMIKAKGEMGTYWTSYLSTRSGPRFLQYVQEHLPEAFHEDHYYDDEWDPRDDDFLKLCATLFKYGGLSADMRSAAVKRMRHYLSYNLEYLQASEFSALLSDEERSEMFRMMRVSASDLLGAMIERHDENYSYSDDPNDIYGTALEYIDAFEEACLGDEEVFKKCATARQRVWQKIAELEDEVKERRLSGEGESRGFRFAGNSPRSKFGTQYTRNIFSDLADPM